MSSGLNGDVPSMSLAGMGASNSAQIGTVTAGETARIPVREGAQYGEGVARGGLLENPCEVPKSSRRPRHDDSQRDGFKLEEGSAHVPDVEHGPNNSITVNTDGNWRLYTNTLPINSIPLGTVTRDGYDIGALVRIKKTGSYVQVNASVIRSLDGRKVAAALGTIGGPGRGQGRKPLADDAPSVVFTMRLTPAQRGRLLAIGGAAWVRAQIDAITSATATRLGRL